MPATPGTFEVLARELGYALIPLKDGLSPTVLAALGLRLPQAFLSRSAIVEVFRQGAKLAGDLPTKIEGLVNAIETNNQGQMIQSGLDLLKQIQVLISVFQQIGDRLQSEANAAGFTATERAEIAEFATQLPVRLLHYALVEYLAQRTKILTANLRLLGLVDNEEVQPNPTAALAAPHVQKAIHLERILDLFNAPDQYFQTLYRWGANDLTGTALFAKLKVLLEQLGIPTDIFQMGGKSVLEAYLFSLQINDLTPPGLALQLRVPANFSVNQALTLNPLWQAIIQTTGRFAAGISGTITPPAAIVLTPPSGTLDTELFMGLKAQSSSGPMIFIGTPGGSRLESGLVEGSLGIVARWNSVLGRATADPALKLAIQQGKLVIDLSQGDGFLTQILSGIKVAADFDIRGIWNPVDGLQLIGSSAIEVLIPVHVDLGLVQMRGIYIIGAIGGAVPFKLDLATELKANLGPLQAVVERMGVSIPITFPADGKGNLGLLDIAFRFRPPNGVGLSVDAGVVKGGGYLFFDFDREEYAGALELVFSGFLTLKAIGLITTKMPDGSKGFSLLIIITAEFGTGLQLGFGFTLLGVGGLLGLNRTMQLQPLVEGVRTGSLNSILFPKDVIANAPKILSDLRKFFPPQQGKFLIGPMAKLGWGTPTLISLSLGIIIEIPGNIAILGVLRVALPTEESALIVLQVSFMGAIEFDKKRIYFFATLFESRILFLTLEGEMGLLMAYGDDPNFVVSVGGFHPRFNPPPLPFPSPNRISINILNEANARIRVMNYFAVTSNTVQFGARAELFFGFSAFSVSGHIGFDALIQFSPFYFIIEVSASVALKAFGVGVFTIRLQFSLEGPTPWRARGTGYLSILFFEISADFDITWGDAKDTTLPPIPVMPILKAEFEKLQNWRAILPRENNLLVSLRKLDPAEELVLHPVGVLRISQKAVPLDLPIDKVGTQRVGDAKRFSVEVASGGLGQTGNVAEQFAIAQFQNLNDAGKLTRRAYDPLTGGLDLSTPGRVLRSSKLVRRRVRYEEIIIDNNYKRFVRRFRAFNSVLFVHFLGSNSVSQSVLSKAYRKKLQPFEERIAVQEEAFIVAFQANNQAFQTTATFNSQTQALAYLKRQTTQNPDLHDRLHVIPQHEVIR